jgi:hypothetical protein
MRQRTSNYCTAWLAILPAAVRSLHRRRRDASGAVLPGVTTGDESGAD